MVSTASAKNVFLLSKKKEEEIVSKTGRRSY